MAKHTFYEFFAGGGLARIGLGPAWTCLFANDISQKKAAAYRTNFAPADELVVGDINDLTSRDLPGAATLAWASFPCQDLSLAGNGKGLQAARSGTFWPFWLLITSLGHEGRAVPIVVLENVPGLLTSNQGRDFQELLTVLLAAGYRFGAMVLDAARFVPQSRARLFIVAVKRDLPMPEALIAEAGDPGVWHPPALLHAYERLPTGLRDSWLWWDLPAPSQRQQTLLDLLEGVPQGVEWHTEEETAYLLALMAPTHLAKVRRVQSVGKAEVGAIYKRIRVEQGVKTQRAEIRFDGLSGCLRTPVGGSSRQIVMCVHGDSIRSRLLSVREAARLMGLPEEYQLPASYNDGYHIMGDGVVVPVVAWLEQHLLRPLAAAVPTLEAVGECSFGS